MVYVHGLWMVGLEGFLLRRRLMRALRASTPRFRYRSVTANLQLNASRLAALMDGLQADQMHLVGHSLGGLVILQLFAQGAGERLPPGRVVLLGSPLGGSRAARALVGWPGGAQLLGRSGAEGLVQPAARRWTEARELGVIAGNRNVGLGRLVTSEAGASDGTVFVDETRIEGMKEHIVIPVNHTGLPFSSQAARLTAHFLLHGQFSS